MASEMVTVRMCRGDLSTSWGFCLEHPGVINQIVGGSLADRAGLQNGDILDEIQGERSPSLSSALRLLDQAKYEIELVVLRDPAASRVWRPKITAEDVVISKFQHSVHNVPPSAPPIATAPPIPPVVKVSLEHQPPPTVQVPGFNATPKVFSPAMETNGRGPTYPTSSVVSHHAENSSYSKNTNDSNLVYANKAEKYLMETGGLFGTDPKVVQAREKGGFVNSETLKLIQEEEKYRGSRRDPVPKNPDAITSREPNAGQGLPHCFICDRSILGLMCKVFDVTLHPDCFQCATCGTSLRNQGHHFLNDKFYCDVHGRQRKAQLGAATSLGKAFEKVSLHQDGRLTAAKPVLDPDLAVKTPPTAAHPVRVPEPPKAAYQPSVMTTQPLLQEKNQTRSQDEPRVVPISIHQENGHKTNGYQHRHTDSALSINTKDSNLTSPLTHTSTTSTEHKKVSTYEHSKKEDRFVSPSEPPREHHSSMSGNMDGVRQRGTLMTQTTRVPVCEQCKQPIRGPFVLAAGLTWCPEHFKCANSTCERRLLDTGFVEENGQKYCEKCFETLIAPICNKCGTPITADCLTALQKQWHPECFVCAHCRRPFGNSAFYLENGQPYCEQDWNSLFTTKCIACKFPIEAGDRWVEAMGSAFHSNCFNCAVCQSNLEGQSFYAKNGLPFCRIHA